MIFGVPYFNIKNGNINNMVSFKFGKKLILSALCCTAVALSCVTGCGVLENFFGQNGQGGNTQTPIAEDRVTGDSDKLAVFANGEPGWAFHKANGYSNGGMFNCTWRNYNIDFNDGTMNISLTAEGSGYAGGEYRTNNDYSFGYYSVSMKPAKCTGIVSSFFTYTNSPRWDEIDIEFLGKDTTKVQFNYFTNGVGGHEYLYDLGFDASEDFHEYGFYWQTDAIIWYVDGKAVYKATADIPQYAGKIMTNVWNGTGVDSWLGAFDASKLPVTARYEWIAYKAD